MIRQLDMPALPTEFVQYGAAQDSKSSYVHSRNSRPEVNRVTLCYRASPLQLSTIDILSVDKSAVTRSDFTASVEGNVTQLVTGWTPLFDSSLKDSAVVEALVNSSYQQHEVRRR